MEEDDRPRGFRLVGYEEDNIKQAEPGRLIPYNAPKSLPPRPTYPALSSYAPYVLLPIALLAFVGTAGLLGQRIVSSSDNTASLPQISLERYQSLSDNSVLNYGVEVALTQPNFFAETREAFIEAEVTFVEADLSAMRLRYFEDGVLVYDFPILAKGERGTWWETPAGLYKVEQKSERRFSTVAQVYQPWSLSFQGNFYIHGQPEYADGLPAPTTFSAGGIRLDDADAEKLFKAVAAETPVLVHEKPEVDSTFVYEPKVPDLKTPHYLIADVKSSTVLASSDLERVAPIASVTKLMTALVAAEHINLDGSVFVSEPNFVQSLIPRLGDRSRVSMYSLMQLLLVESSNEAAEVIAAQLGREEFINKMNQKARSLGMLNTNFADPSGLSAENTSSLGDLLRLAQYIYTNRSFILEMTANQNQATVYTSGDFGTLTNFNRVTDLSNFIGGKVGETIAAGQTSVTLHQLEVKGEKRVVAIVILGSQSRNDDVLELLRYASERFGG
jgi:serine-type D-Ala-D-Ala endopeptidase (penicillin-binding protein 7)